MRTGDPVSTDLFLPNLVEKVVDMVMSGVRGTARSVGLPGEGSTIAESVRRFANVHSSMSGFDE